MTGKSWTWKDLSRVRTSSWICVGYGRRDGRRDGRRVTRV